MQGRDWPRSRRRPVERRKLCPFKKRLGRPRCLPPWHEISHPANRTKRPNRPLLPRNNRNSRQSKNRLRQPGRSRRKKRRLLRSRGSRKDLPRRRRNRPSQPRNARRRQERIEDSLPRRRLRPKDGSQAGKAWRVRQSEHQQPGGPPNRCRRKKLLNRQEQQTKAEATKRKARVMAKTNLNARRVTPQGGFILRYPGKMSPVSRIKARRNKVMKTTQIQAADNRFS